MAGNSKQLYLRLLRYSRRYTWRIVFSVAASLLVAGTDVATAKLVEPLIDQVINAGNAALVNLVPVIIIGLAVTKGVGRYIQEYLIKTAGQLVVQDIRNDVYGHSLGMSMGFFGQTTTGIMMSRILNDVGVMQRSAADILVDGVRETFTLIGLVGLAFYQDWKLAALAFMVLPVSVIPASVIGRRIKEGTRRGQAKMGDLTGILQETFAGIKVIKAFGTEGQENDRFQQENFRFYRFMRKVLKYDSASAPVIEILAGFGMAVVFWYGIQRVISGAISQGELLSFAVSLGMMYGPVKKLIKVSNTIQRSLGAAERVFELLDQAPEIVDSPTARPLPRAQGEVIFDRVGFAYSGEPVLQDFSLTAHPGEIIALVGPSGAGKSTVVGLLTRFYDPQHGSIRIDGLDLREITLASLRENIALVDQETFLFNDTLFNNIRYGRQGASEAEIIEAARQAYADEFIQLLPEGYQTRIGDRGSRLSGGQRQRICIARALLRDTPILLLDEATSALDTESEAMVQKALANLMENRTTFVIAHRLSTVINADRIVVMEEGRIQESGRHQELLDRNGLYRRLYEMQFQESA